MEQQTVEMITKMVIQTLNRMEEKKNGFQVPVGVSARHIHLTKEHVEALYGVGSTVAILNRLDEGVIDGLITYNQFDEGYLGIERAVEAIQGTAPGRREEMEAYYIEAEDLQEGTYEKLLYPMQ